MIEPDHVWCWAISDGSEPHSIRVKYAVGGGTEWIVELQDGVFVEMTVAAILNDYFLVDPHADDVA